MIAELYFRGFFNIHRFGAPRHEYAKCDYFYCGCRRNTNVYNLNGFTYYDVPKAASQKIRKSIGRLGRHTSLDSTLWFLNQVVGPNGQYNIYSSSVLTPPKFLIERFRRDLRRPLEMFDAEESKYRFAFVRDPMERVKSAYKMFRYPNNLPRIMLSYHLFGNLNFSFDEFIRFIEKNPSGNCHFLPATSFIPSDRDINIYKVENFKADFQKVSKQIDVKYDTSFVNKSSDISDLKISNSARRIIERLYLSDYERFNY